MGGMTIDFTEHGLRGTNSKESILRFTDSWRCSIQTVVLSVACFEIVDKAQDLRFKRNPRREYPLLTHGAIVPEEDFVGIFFKVVQGMESIFMVSYWILF